ncbi:MAG: molybdenum cofactor synthesis domain-containing protein [Marinilabiliaceae bacterium]|jgi:molybdenum cofactor synthesis domain-containing protein|nr:molybdenum cofactor synthesis domain-containing protein [Marinilabiliaceae bacterium]
MSLPDKYKCLVITLSDRAYAGEYKDESGPAIKLRLDDYFKDIGWEMRSELTVLPDDVAVLRQLINESSQTYDVIITTGGTGIGPRDFTVNVVRDLLDFEIPGIMELIRVKYGMDKPNALLSRGIAGVKDQSLIYTLPGSLKAVNEYMEEILKSLQHAIYMKHGVDVHDRH